MRKIYAIGDIHGCYDQLLTLMEKIPIDFKRGTLVFFGALMIRPVLILRSVVDIR